MSFWGIVFSCLMATPRHRRVASSLLVPPSFLSYHCSRVDVLYTFSTYRSSFVSILASRVPPVWLPQVYYAAVVVDLLLRFNWLYSIIPPGHNPLPFIHSSTLPVVITTNVIVCEFLRRTMWGFFRVENEHLNNTEVTESSERREKYGRGYLYRSCRV